jgi:hypothetical protein
MARFATPTRRSMQTRHDRIKIKELWNEYELQNQQRKETMARRSQASGGKD